MAKYLCCGLSYPDGKALTDHMREDHNVPEFALVVACCGKNFRDTGEMSQHMKTEHKIYLSVEV